ncbi:UNVERIFIED_ORG: hypothetical protein J3D58_002155 [Paenarthrobacter nicotinovorans]|uniref:Uncharacterized protein n=1 Tax=Paenarthrobacter histidinolovorans TaxID=43664 RepID=A0ABW8N4S1_9MICC
MAMFLENIAIFCHLGALSSARGNKKAAVSPKETLPPFVICGPELVL